MKIKRLLAGAMTFVFSLSMVHINVNAEEFTEKATDEKEKITVILEEDAKEVEQEDVAKAESTEESTAKKVLVKVLSGAKTMVFAGSNLGLFAIKNIFGLIKSGVEWVAVGVCVAVGYTLSNEFILKLLRREALF